MTNNIPIIQFDKWLGGKRAAVALTFDGWTPSHYEVALPLLNKLNIIATFL